MRSVRFVLAVPMAASALGGAVALATPTQAARKAPLAVVPATQTAVAGEAVLLSVTGGPKRGRLRFTVEGERCTFDKPSRTLRLDAPWGGDCSVTARKVNSKGRRLSQSEPVVVSFARRPLTPRAFNGEPCTIVGTEGPDVLRGTDEDDVICGAGGNDEIAGLDGDDVIDGGPGIDIVDGGGGDNLCDYDAGELPVGTCRYDNAAPEVSLTVAPSVVDATRSGAETHMVFTVKDEGGVNNAGLFCYSGGGTALANWNVTVVLPGPAYPDVQDIEMRQFGQMLTEDRLSWTMDGDGVTFDLRVPLGRAAESGPVTCQLHAGDRLGHSTHVEIPSVFEVTAEPVEEVDPPTVESLEISPATVDLSQGQPPVTAIVKVDAPGGLNLVDARCWVPGREVRVGEFLGPYFGYYSRSDALPLADSVPVHLPSEATFTMSRSEAKSVLHFTWPLPSNVVAGVYDCEVTVTDELGTRVSEVFEEVLTLEASAERDNAGPQMASATLSPNVVNVGLGSQDLTVTLSPVDASGVRMVTMTCYTGEPMTPGYVEADELRLAFVREFDGSDRWSVESGGQGGHRSVVYGADLGGRINPTLSGTVTVPFGYAPASYSCSLMMQDDLGNGSAVTMPDFLTVLRTNG